MKIARERQGLPGSRMKYCSLNHIQVVSSSQVIETHVAVELAAVTEMR